jgi:hypothetical protein
MGALSYGGFVNTNFLAEIFNGDVNGLFVNKVPADIQIYTYFTTGLDPKRLKDVILELLISFF